MKKNLLNNRYTIKEKIGDGGMGTVYRAIDSSNGNRVAIKIFNSALDSRRPEDLIRFKNEALNASGLNHPVIPRIHEISITPPDRYMVMEFIEGQGLDTLISGAPHGLPAEVAVEIIYQLCGGLEQAHQAGLVHRGLSPRNIMVSSIDNSASSKIRVALTDFGCALIREFPEIGGSKFGEGDILTPHAVAAIFTYMAPEQLQAGRHHIDGRADLYSLGIIFYELIAGQPPFILNGPHSILHQHLARLPVPPSAHRSALSPVIDRIILKLLEKDPEQRYQGAAGLRADLDRLRAGETDFTPGLRDRIIRLTFAAEFVGRGKELSAVMEMAGAMAAGKGGVCIISGEAGLGKTRLVEAIEQQLVAQGIVIANGKCFAGESKTPYGPFSEALDEYLRNYRAYPDAQKAKISAAIAGAMKGLGAILLTLNRNLSVMIPEPPVLVPLESDREKKRFLLTAADFFLALARAEQGLVLVLDDIHWADEGTIALLNEITADIERYPLLVIVACRDSEVRYRHGLKKYLAAAKEKRLPIQRLTLAPFTPDEIALFAGRLFRRPPDDPAVKTLADFMRDKSSGNPFFIFEMSKQLFEQRLVYYHDDGSLMVERERLTEIILPGTMIEVLMQRISRLEPEEIEVLAHAAVIGKRFAGAFLYSLFEEAEPAGAPDGLSVDDIVGIIDRAIAFGLMNTDPHDPAMFSFAHDAIREALCQTLSANQRRALHATILDAMERQATANQTDAADNALLFDLAHHAIEAGNRDKTLRYAARAGLLAKAHHAAMEAIDYLSWVMIYLESMNDRDERWIETNLAIGACYLAIGKNDTAIAILKGVLPFITPPHDKSALYYQLCRASFNAGDWNNCEEYAGAGLRFLGEALPIGRAATIIALVKEMAAHMLIKAARKLLKQSAADRSDEDAVLVIQTLYTLGWSYVINDSAKFIRVVLRMMNVAEWRLGESKELATSLAAYAALCTIVHRPKASLGYQERALSIRMKLDDEWGTAQSYQFYAYGYYFTGQIHKAVDYYEQSIILFKKIGDLKELGNSLSGIIWCHIVYGDYPREKAAIDEYANLAERLNDTFARCYAELFYGSYYQDVGDQVKSLEHLRTALSISMENGFSGLQCITLVHIGRCHILSGEYVEALRYFTDACLVDQTNRLFPESVSFLYHELAAATIIEYANNFSLSNKEKVQRLRSIKQYCRTAWRKNRRSIINRGGTLRVMAQLQSLLGNVKKAERLFLESIQHLEAIQYRCDLARSICEYGIFLSENGRQEIGRLKVEEAYRIFKTIGNASYIRRAATFLGLGGKESLLPEELFITRIRDHQKMSAIMSLITEVSSNADFDSLLDRALMIVMEILGAGRGCIVSADKGLAGDIICARGMDAASIGRDALDLIRQLLDRSDDTPLSGPVGRGRAHPVLSIPVRYADRTVAVCYLDNPLVSGMFAADDIEIAHTLMKQIGTRIALRSLKGQVDRLNAVEPGEDFCATYRITQREKELIMLLGKGVTRKEIAQQLDISYRTVRFHIDNIVAKTGVRSDVELVQLVKKNIG